MVDLLWYLNSLNRRVSSHPELRPVYPMVERLIKELISGRMKGRDFLVQAYKNITVAWINADEQLVGRGLPVLLRRAQTLEVWALLCEVAG